MAAVIKKHYPDTKVTFAVREYTRPIPDFSTVVDHTLVVPGEFEILPMVRQLREQSFDCIFIVSPNFKVAMAAMLAGIPIRIGTAYRWYSFLFNKPIRDHRSAVLYHEAQYNVRMLSEIGIQELLTKSGAEYALQLPAEIENEAARILEANNIGNGEKYCILHPGSGGSAVDLPIEKFIELAELIHKRTLLKIVCTGSKDETQLCQKIGNAVPAVNFAGKLTLPDLMGLIEKSFIFVSNSTGPLHLASAMGKQVIGFFPKVRVCSAERWGPWTEKASVFTPGIACTDCTIGQCGKLNCMQSIDMMAVCQTIEAISKTVLLENV